MYMHNNIGVCYACNLYNTLLFHILSCCYLV